MLVTINEAVSVSATLPQAFAAGDRIPAAFELTASGADQGKFRPYGHDGYWSYPDADFAGGGGGLGGRQRAV